MSEDTDPTAPADDAGETAAPQPFTIADEATATWAVDKINAARAELARRKAAAREWVEEAQREVARLEARFSPELRAWGLANLPRDKKTVVLRSGKLQYRNRPGRFAITDRVRATIWAKAHLPAAVITTEDVAFEALDAYARATGETPAGMEWQPEQENDSFSIR